MKKIKGYAAFNLTKSSRQIILASFPAKFNNIVAHHITYKFNVFDDEKIPSVSVVTVVGFAEDENAQALVVEVEGSSKRPDGGIFHITICHNSRVKPYYSNELLSKGYNKINPFEINVIPTFNAF